MMNSTTGSSRSTKKDVVKTFSVMQPGSLPNYYIHQLDRMGYAIVDVKRLPSRVILDIQNQDEPQERFMVTLWQIPKWQGEQVSDITVYPLAPKSDISPMRPQAPLSSEKLATEMQR